MNNYQLNRMKMYRSVTDFLDRWKGNIGEMPICRKSVGIITVCMKRIEELHVIQMNSRWGFSPEKKARKKELLDLMCKMSAKLCLFAKLTGSNTLFKEVKFTPWTLSRISQVELPGPANTLYDRAQKHLAELTEYGITAVTQKKFREVIDAYIESIPFPRSEKVKSVTATQEIAEAFAKADNALEMIDMLAESEKYSDPAFWSAYRFNRKLVNSGKVRMALKAQAVRKSDGTPLSHVLFTFVLRKPERKTSKQGLIIRKKTGKQGGFYILHIAPGNYEITVSKPGYNEQKLEKYIDDKELFRMRVEMEKCTSVH